MTTRDSLTTTDVPWSTNGAAPKLSIDTSDDGIPAASPEQSPQTPALMMLSSSGTDGFSPGSAATERSETSSVSFSPTTEDPQCAERVIEYKEMEPLSGRVFTDIDNPLLFGLSAAMEEDQKKQASEAFAEELRKLSVCVHMHHRKGPSKTELPKSMNCEAEGQACFISTGNGIVMATVKHNLSTGMGVGEEGQEQYEELISAVVMTHSGSFKFPDGNSLYGWNKDALTTNDAVIFEEVEEEGVKLAEWKYGDEVVVIPLSFFEKNGAFNKYNLSEDIKQGSVKTFKAVGADFTCTKGMKVGILVHSHSGTTAKAFQKALDSNKNARNPYEDPYEAKSGDTFITVGEITFVGDGHIEYTTNSVTGFSGGPVVLIDPNSPDHLKVIAVHAGFLDGRRGNTFGINFGFLVSGKIQECLDSNDAVPKITAKPELTKEQIAESVPLHMKAGVAVILNDAVPKITAKTEVTTEQIAESVPLHMRASVAKAWGFIH